MSVLFRLLHCNIQNLNSISKLEAITKTKKKRFEESYSIRLENDDDDDDNDEANRDEFRECRSQISERLKNENIRRQRQYFPLKPFVLGQFVI